jgi:LCP family protein required for cell wall assembly
MARGSSSGSDEGPSGPGSRPTPFSGLEALGQHIDQQGSASASPPGPEETPTPGASPGSGSSPNGGSTSLEGLAALGKHIENEQRAARKHPKRRRRLAWTFGIIGLVIVLGAGAALGYAWYLNHEIHRIDVKGLTDAPSDGLEQNTENILMVGSTSRCALKTQYIGYGICSEGVNGVNSDVVMILHLNATKGTVSILSIPRDLFIPNARKEGANKIDAALYEGPTQLVSAIQDDFGIPIQHYVELNFDSFANVVNALGGINMYFPEPVYDAYSGLDIQTTGCIHLDGFHALQVVRARHLQYKPPGITTDDPAYWPQEAQSDLARIRRDHEFLRVLATAVAKRGLSNPLTDQSLISGLVGQLVVDNGFSASNMINLVLTFHGVNISKSPQLTVPVSVDQFGDYIYQGGDYGDIEFPSQPQDQSVVNQFLALPNTINSMTGKPLPASSTVTVSVLNGTGVTDQAADTAASLQALGFHIMGTGDTPSVGQEAETVVYYNSKAANVVAAAQAVERSMTGAVIMGRGPVSDGAEVTVVTGTDFAVNAPKASSTSTTSGVGAPTTSPTTTTTTSSNGDFAPPSPAVEALEPWDPRSCTASGQEGP